MEGFELIKQGAEAKLHKGTYLGKSAIIKERFVKAYRHPDLDKNLTKERIKAECKAIVKCKAAGVITPTIYYADLTKRIIIMEYFENNIMAKDFIAKSESDSTEKLSQRIGQELAKMHSADIIHGDLTTSNILLINKKNSQLENFDELEIAFIDFGLSHIDSSAEDKGVDLYVLERALLSTHSNAESIFPVILSAYKKQYGKKCKEIITKYEEVRARGRKRTMVG